MAFVWRWLKTFLPYDGAIDRRRFPRFNCMYKIRYCFLRENSIQNEAIIDNVSKVGLRIKSARQINKGDIIRMNIDPNVGNRVISGYGIVRWVNNISDQLNNTVKAAGVEFLEIEPFDVDMMISSSN